MIFINMNFTRISSIVIASIISFFSLSETVAAQTVNRQPKDTNQLNLPTCYMQTEDGKILNLQNLCGGGSSVSAYQQNNYVDNYGGYPSESYFGNCQYSWQVDSSGRSCGNHSTNSLSRYSQGRYNNNYSPSYYSPSYGGASYHSYPSGSSSSGVCNVPSDVARDGSRCGGRAASEKRGGR
jgi:hypothetical protein